MRIAGGEWRGRVLKAPAGDAVRPTQDRVREALFSMLGPILPGAVVLDLFAGAGTVGLEALSRGAARAVFVELSSAHARILGENVATLGAGNRAKVVCADARRWVETAAAEGPFDLVYADPPYELGAQMGYAGMLQTLASGGAVASGGIFVAEMKLQQEPDASEQWELLRDRVYGQTRLAVYRRK